MPKSSGTRSSVSAANPAAAARRRAASRMAAASEDEAAAGGPAAVNGAEPALVSHETPHDEDLRLRIFIIDTGWNSAASRVLKENTEVLCNLTEFDPIYVLDRKTSVEMLRKHRELVGRDPIISVHNMRALEKHGTGQQHGFRIHLGLLKSESQVLVALRMFADFLARYSYLEGYRSAGQARAPPRGNCRGDRNHRRRPRRQGARAVMQVQRKGRTPCLNVGRTSSQAWDSRPAWPMWCGKSAAGKSSFANCSMSSTGMTRRYPQPRRPGQLRQVETVRRCRSGLTASEHIPAAVSQPGSLTVTSPEIFSRGMRTGLRCLPAACCAWRRCGRSKSIRPAPRRSCVTAA